MTTSSAAGADLDAVCRALVGRDVVAADRIGTGRNSRVFRVMLAGAEPPARVVVKFYRRDPGDGRDRLATEFGGLQFLWQNGVRAIPCPIAVDRDRHCAIYECIDGAVPDSRSVDGHDIDACVRFLAALETLGAQEAARGLAVASEACFSLGAIVASIAGRHERLRAADREGDGRAMHRWLMGTFEPLMREVFAWCRRAARCDGLAFDHPIDPCQRTLSPSDFGFHNAIRRPDGSLAFVDFEYFGWDDPAKMAVDFVLHPGMVIAGELRRRFVAALLSSLHDVPGLPARVRIAYPLFGLKWSLILLNEFLPERIASSVDARAVRAAQLAKADAMAERIRREYRENPLL